MNLHKFIDELWENGSSNFNLCTGVMGEYSSQSLHENSISIVKNKEDIPKKLTKFIIENGFDLSFPDNSISGVYRDNLLILGISTDLV
jgi:hypothetical protein